MLTPVERALDDYDRGRAALEDGDPTAARAAFAAARAHHNDAPSLLTWEAYAAREAGDTQGALALLTDGLARWPAHPELRVHRAALLVQAGALSEAADDLRAAFATGAVHPLDLAEDPDFAPLQSDPAFRDLIPPPAVEVAVRSEAGAVLQGDRWLLELDLVGPAGGAASIERYAPLPPQLALEEVIEELAASGGRLQRRKIEARYRARGPGQGVLGPWRVTIGAAVSDIAAVPVDVVEVPDRPPATAYSPVSLPLPSQLGPTSPEPGVQRVGRGVVVTTPPGARVEVVGPDGAALPALRLELREDGATRLVRYWLPAGTAGQVRVTRAGLTLLDAALP